MFGDDAWSYLHINTNGTFVIIGTGGTYTQIGGGVPPKGILGGVEVNTVGSTWTVSIYDGPAVAANLVAVITPGTGQPDLEGPIKLLRGLIIVTAGTTPGDVTVKYV